MQLEKKIQTSKKEEIDLRSDKTNNLFRTIAYISTLPECRELLRGLAKTINWSEESKRYIIGYDKRREEYLDTTRDILYNNLPEDTLIDLIDEQMLLGKYDSYEKIPYFLALSKLKFNFLEQYIKEQYRVSTLKKTNHSNINLREEGLPTAIDAVLESVYSEERFYAVPFTPKNQEKIDYWFTRINEIISITQEHCAPHDIDYNKNSSYTIKLKQDISYIWLAMTFLNDSKNEDRYLQKVKNTFNTKDLNVDLALDYIFIEDIEDESAWIQKRITNGFPFIKFKKQIINYITNSLDIETYTTIIGRLSENKSKNATLALEALCKSLHISIKSDINRFFFGNQHVGYSQKELMQIDAKKKMKNYANLKEKLDLMLSNPITGTKLQELFSFENSNSGVTSMSNVICESLANQCPLMVLAIEKVMPTFVIKLEGHKFSLAQTVWLYKALGKSFRNLDTNSSELWSIDSENVQQIQEEKINHDKKSNLGSDPFYKFHENYNIRRIQYIEFGVNEKDLLSINILDKLFPVNQADKEYVVDFLKIKLKKINKIPGFCDFKIKNLNEIELEKTILSIAIEQNGNKKSSFPKKI